MLIRHISAGTALTAVFKTIVFGQAIAATDRCALVKDSEIDEAIGPHEPGHAGLPNEWGNNSCRWTA